MTDYPPPVPETKPYQSSVEVPVTKAVNLTQLTDELRTATKVEVALALTGPRTPSPEDPGVLHISPARVREDQVLAVLAAHQPDPQWGVPEGEVDFAALLARVLDDPAAELSDDEVKIAVLGLLRRAATPRR